MSKTKSFTLGGKTLPIDLHTAWDAEDGKPLSVGDGEVQFDFDFRDIRFVGRCREIGDHAQLKLVGDVGPMPFSAESPAARQGLGQIIEAANLHMGGENFRTSQGRILLGNDLTFPAPITATGLVTAVSLFLLPALPYLELVAMYIRPPLAPAKRGESAVRLEWRRR
ncbi:conserved hypothetical protein [Candidatus Terasakiella magnetica]|nr:conserved hypothetical protein [Candidatus Terasakiella magnetica]